VPVPPSAVGMERALRGPRCMKAERPPGRRGSREGRTDVRVLRLWRIGPGLHPRQESCAPLPVSLGTAEVGAAYRKPARPVKSQPAGGLRATGERQGIRNLQQTGLRSKSAGRFRPGIWS
jgi:hypothetical protein